MLEDMMSGTKAGRSGLTKALETLREADTLIVEAGSAVLPASRTRSIPRPPPGGSFFNVVACLTQMERELMVECTRVGPNQIHMLGLCEGLSPCRPAVCAYSVAT